MTTYIGGDATGSIRVNLIKFGFEEIVSRTKLFYCQQWNQIGNSHYLVVPCYASAQRTAADTARRKHRFVNALNNQIELLLGHTWGSRYPYKSSTFVKL